MSQTAKQLLATAPAALTALEGEVLLARALAMPRASLLAHLDDVVVNDSALLWHESVKRRVAGEPLAYILGTKEFYGRPFQVTPDTLVPRPETEELVDHVLAESAVNIIDVGTGSGCIAVTLALESSSTVWGSDISAAALNVARLNAATYGATARFIEADLLDWPETLPEAATTILVANLPYVPDQWVDEHFELQAEPALALRGGADGLEVIRRLLQWCQQHQWFPATLWLEIDPAQAAAVHALSPHPAEFFPDMAGQTRFVKITRRTA